MIVLLIVLLSILGAIAYASVAGYAGKTILMSVKANCKSCSQGYNCYSEHWFPAGTGGLLWPIGIPMMIAMSKVEDPNSPKKTKAELAREEEEKQAKHNEKIATINLRAAELVARENKVLDFHIKD